MEIKNSTLLITGGSSGIGLEFVKQLTRQGAANIIITGRDNAKLEQTKTEFSNVHTFQSDVANANDIDRLHNDVIKQFPRLNILINNAGIMRDLNVLDSTMSLEDVTREIDTNLSGTIRMVHRFLPHLTGQKTAAIVNISSGLAFVPFPASPIYSAAKAGVHAYTQVLRLQLKHTSVAVFEVAPPSTDTPLQDAFSNIEMGNSSPVMKVDKVVSEAIKGILKNKLEIVPGMAKALKLMGRVAPGFFMKYMDKLIEKGRKK